MSTLRFCGVSLVLAAPLALWACGDASGDGSQFTGVGGSAAASAGGSGAGAGGGTAASGAGGSAAGSGFIDAGEEDAGACESVTQEAELVPPIIEFVLDTSGSMDNASPGGGGTKWEVTRAALVEAINGAQGLPDFAAVGITYYPNTGYSGSCINKQQAVPIAQLTASHRGQLAGSLTAQTPDGLTPSHDGWDYGLQQVKASQLAGNRFIVLMTDGAANYGLGCASDENNPGFIAAVGQAAQVDGVRTFVVGSPGSDNYKDVLSQLADAGATGPGGCSSSGPTYCHFDMTASSNFATDLSAALAEITGQALSCEMEIPPPPPGSGFDPDRVNVDFVDGSGGLNQLARDPSGNCTHGWDYSADGTKIIICGTDCDLVRSDPNGRIEVALGCATRVQ